MRPLTATMMRVVSPRAARRAAGPSVSMVNAITVWSPVARWDVTSQTDLGVELGAEAHELVDRPCWRVPGLKCGPAVLHRPPAGRS